MNSGLNFLKTDCWLWIWHIWLSGHSEGRGRRYSDWHCASPTVHSLFEVGINGPNFGWENLSGLFLEDLWQREWGRKDERCDSPFPFVWFCLLALIFLFPSRFIQSWQVWCIFQVNPPVDPFACSVIIVCSWHIPSMGITMVSICFMISLSKQKWWSSSVSLKMPNLTRSWCHWGQDQLCLDRFFHLQSLTLRDFQSRFLIRVFTCFCVVNGLLGEVSISRKFQ